MKDWNHLTKAVCWPLHLDRWLVPSVELFERQLALEPVALFAVADFVFEWREKVERDVCGLKVLRIGVGNVMRQRSEG